MQKKNWNVSQWQSANTMESNKVKQSLDDNHDSEMASGVALSISHSL